MKLKSIMLVVSLLFVSCKNKPKTDDSITIKELEVDTVLNLQNTEVEKEVVQSYDTLSIGKKDFRTMLQKIEHVKHTGKKHEDWMSNRTNYFFQDLFDLSIDDYKITTTSYTYKKKCIFYLHTLAHVSDTISMKPYIENAIYKLPGGYMEERFLIFAMKDSLKAHFIDIPPNYGYSTETNELIKKVNEGIDIITISCDAMRLCRFKDSRI